MWYGLFHSGRPVNQAARNFGPLWRYIRRNDRNVGLFSVMLYLNCVVYNSGGSVAAMCAKTLHCVTVEGSSHCSVGLNTFHSIEMDWVWHKARHYPFQCSIHLTRVQS